MCVHTLILCTLKYDRLTTWHTQKRKNEENAPCALRSRSFMCSYLLSTITVYCTLYTHRWIDKSANGSMRRCHHLRKSAGWFLIMYIVRVVVFTSCCLLTFSLSQSLSTKAQLSKQRPQKLMIVRRKFAHQSCTVRCVITKIFGACEKRINKQKTTWFIYVFF